MMTKFSELLQSVLKHRSALGVAGLIIVCALLILFQILGQPIFTKIDAASTVGLLSLIVRCVFGLAVTAVVVSGLAYVLPARLFVPVSKVEYSVAIFRMFDPTAEPIAALNDRFEPHVGFPYYSRESDHPSHWPARVARDRGALSKRFEAFFGRADVQTALAAARAEAGDDSKVEVVGSGSADNNLSAVIAGARLFFNFTLDGDEARLIEALGEPMAREFLAVEDARSSQRDYLPNRVAILRLRNAGTRTVRDVTIEYEVAGYVYDTKVRAVAEGASDESLPFEHRLIIPKLLAGQAYDITIWYSYQSVSERVFPDKTNFIQELTQGFTVSNIAVASGGKVVFKSDLLKGVPAYERLYDGNGRPSDNPERELAALFEAMAAETATAMDAYDEEHLKANDLSLDGLADFPISEAQIDNVWVDFQSPAGKHYCAVCVYQHPRGPYALLSSTDRDEADFVTARAALADALDGEPKSEITDRSDDICSTISIAAGFTRPAIIKAFHTLEVAGFHGVQVSKLHYRKNAE